MLGTRPLYCDVKKHVFVHIYLLVDDEKRKQVLFDFVAMYSKLTNSKFSTLGSKKSILGLHFCAFLVN